MIPQIARLSLAVATLMTLSACAGTGGDDPTQISGGAIELAVSVTCTEEPQCITVNGQNVLAPSEFDRAEVDTASVAKKETQNAVDVRLTDDGKIVLQSLTEAASLAGSSARLVFKIGDEPVAAVAVPEALTGNQIQIVLAPGDSVEEILELIRRG